MKTLIYGVYSAIWCYALWYDIYRQPRIGSEYYIYKLVMLTNICFVLLTAYSVLVVINRLFNFKRLKAFIDFSFYTSVGPVALATCSLYWGLYSYDPEFVMPEWIRNLIPEWLNQVTHTYPVIYVFLDALMTQHIAPSFKKCFLLSTLLIGFYWGVIFYIKRINGYWIYPIFELYTEFIFGLAIFIAIFGYFGLITILIGINRLVWGRSTTKETKVKSR